MKKLAQMIRMILPVLLFLTGCSESITNAGYNTLLGMGMAFFVLVLISLVIALFPGLDRMQRRQANKQIEEEMRLQSINQTISHIEQQERVTTQKEAAPMQETPAPPAGDDELIAVIGAAIAAYESSTGTRTTVRTEMPAGYTGGYYARPVSRVRRKNWKRA